MVAQRGGLDHEGGPRRICPSSTPICIGGCPQGIPHGSQLLSEQLARNEHDVAAESPSQNNVTPRQDRKATPSRRRTRVAAPTARGFSGLVSEVRIWGSTRSQYQILRDMVASLDGPSERGSSHRDVGAKGSGAWGRRRRPSMVIPKAATRRARSGSEQAAGVLQRLFRRVKFRRRLAERMARRQAAKFWPNTPVGADPRLGRVGEKHQVGPELMAMIDDPQAGEAAVIVQSWVREHARKCVLPGVMGTLRC